MSNHIEFMTRAWKTIEAQQWPKLAEQWIHSSAAKRVVAALIETDLSLPALNLWAGIAFVT